MTRTWMIALALLALSGAASPIANAAGGGSSAPSSSGPSYDPVEEYQKGVQALRDQNYKAAERAMKRVIKVAKRDANSHYILGLAHFGQEEYKSSAKALSKAVRYDETLYDAHAKLGMSYLLTDKPEKAEKVLTDLNEAKAICAGTCDQASAIETAIMQIEGMKSQPGPTETSDLAPPIIHASLDHGDLLYADAVRLINLERYDEAITELKTAAAILGPHPDVLTYLGFAHRKKGASDEALTYYTEALTIAPEHLNAIEYLGEYYVEQGNYAAAQVQLMKLEALCPFGCAQIEELRDWIGDTPT
ncbi:MAG: tetratricopeptide repeat protein [Henriciella sp.]|nr:tetratricopeptide repeat protein [Henriciella sp.]